LHWGDFFHSVAESLGRLFAGYLIDRVNSFSLLGGLEKKKTDLSVLLSMSKNVSLAAAGSGK
jgi:hypothetical protein